PHHHHSHSLPTRRSSDLSGLINIEQSTSERGVVIQEAANRSIAVPISAFQGSSVPERSQDEVGSLGGGMQITLVTQAADFVLTTDRKSTRLNSSHVAISY